MSAVDDDLLRRLDASPVLSDPRLAVRPLPGGLTNRNLDVTTASGRYVARLSGPGSALLGIDRVAEHHNSVAAAATGVAPGVADFRPEAELLVVDFVEARTMTADGLHDLPLLERVSRAVRQLHGAEPFLGRFDMQQVQRRYLDTCLDNGFRLPDGYLDLAAAADRVFAALAVDPGPLVPCHNDLLAENILDGGERIWLIDYEYSGLGDPCFELGNLAAESDLTDTEADHLATTYLGREDPRWLARCRLQGVMSQYGWVLWGVIQHHGGGLGHDLWPWTVAKYERAARGLTSSALTELLPLVAGERR